MFANLVVGRSNIRLIFTSMRADICRHDLYRVMRKTDVVTHLKLSRHRHVRGIAKKGDEQRGEAIRRPKQDVLEEYSHVA